MGNKSCSSFLINKILEKNKICADCGGAKPDWASLNLGVLLCIECSGVHRSLGVHISKVRSLCLDDISESEARLLLALGNDNINSFRERNSVDIQNELTKPKPQSSRSTKEQWISWKYRPHKPSQSSKEMNPNKSRVNEYMKAASNHLMFKAAEECDIIKLAEGIGNGGDVHFKEEKNGRTALHAVIMSSPYSSQYDNVARRTADIEVEYNQNNHMWNKIVCAELLLQNGARISTLDKNLDNVLDCAYQMNAEQDILDYLTLFSRRSKE